MSREQLLHKAAALYQRAGSEWSRDAARCYSSIGEYDSAGQVLELALSFEAAAEAFKRAQRPESWRRAAHCYEVLKQYREAGDCYYHAGILDLAAWTYAHFARAPGEALRCLGEWTPASEAQKIEKDVIHARIEADGDEMQAARNLAKAIAAAAQLERTYYLAQPLQRALEAAEYLGRSDLAALVHAAATQLGLQGGRENWQKWCLERFNVHLQLDQLLHEELPPSSNTAAP